jgi:hypothetical protein
VYFVAEGVLAQGATPGLNLYVLHDGGGVWTTRFVAKLSAADDPDWAGQAAGRLTELPARVSPNGRYFAFMSQRSLTGYDNLDANSGQPDEEVYLYHAETSESGQLEPGHLICASCDPSGAQPVGIEAKPAPREAINDDNIWEPGTGLAAVVPGWIGIRSETKGRHQPRYLSDSGRLFFDSVDPLVPQATNGVADVYEYEPGGLGSCTSSRTTFDVPLDGCVALISGGSSAEEAVFIDASENGDDVFFVTSTQLASQDLDTAFDVYDAHVCSTAEPCPAASASSLPCATADACRTAPPPQPAIFGAPSSATFSGVGNVATAPTPGVNTKPKSKLVRCSKGFVKKKGKCVKKHKAKKKVKRSVKKSTNGKRGK